LIRVNNVVITENAQANDSLVDTPTSYGTDTGVGGEARGNYATLNPLNQGPNTTLSNGNLDYLTTSAGSLYRSAFSTIGMSSGKWYFEATAGTFGGDFMLGLSKTLNNDTYIGSGAQSWAYEAVVPAKVNNGSFVSTGYSTYTTGDVISVAFDADNGRIFFAKNGTWQESGNPATGANPAYTGLTSGPYFFGCSTGPNGTWQGLNFGQRAFAYTAPSGFKALVDTNLPTPVVAKPNTLMDVKLYTGNGSTQTISGLGFSPDLVWIKARSAAYNHELYDTVRGALQYLSSSTTNAESTLANSLTAFGSDGFSVGSQVGSNGSGTTFAAWTWDAGTSTVTNTAGSITSQVRANPAAGFSIVTHTIPSSGGPWTVGHGLNVAPSLIISKSRSTSGSWITYHASSGNTGYLLLNATDAFTTQSQTWNSTTPSSTVFTQGTAAWWGANYTYVSYCFAPVSGYSTALNWTGNGDSNGIFLHCGFKPRLILIKMTNSTESWVMVDTARNPYNLCNSYLFANSSNAEGTAPLYDILSNGIKFRSTAQNDSGAQYVAFAWAESPFQYARAR
jgi:hypothetical protein